MRFFCLGLLFLIPHFSLYASPIPHEVKTALMQEIRDFSALQVMPNYIKLKPSHKKQTYQALIGAYMFYISDDGKFVIRDNYLASQHAQSLSERKKRAIRLNALKTLNENSMIIFTPQHIKHTITAFIDIKQNSFNTLHHHLDKLLKMGVKVRYLVAPSNSVTTRQHQKVMAIWCAHNRKKALKTVIKRQKIRTKKCYHPITAHHSVAASLGIKDTSIILDTGQLYKSVPTMNKLLSALRQ